jgi:hypothetical protein
MSARNWASNGVLYQPVCGLDAGGGGGPPESVPPPAGPEVEELVDARVREMAYDAA